MTPFILSDDLIGPGVARVAEFCGMPKRRAYHLIAKGELPTFMLGGRVYARKSTLLKHIADRERQAQEGEAGDA